MDDKGLEIEITSRILSLGSWDFMCLGEGTILISKSLKRTIHKWICIILYEHLRVCSSSGYCGTKVGVSICL